MDTKINFEHKWCPNQGTPYLYRDSHTDKTRHIVKARCKMWKCEYCSKVNRHQHYIRILNGCNELLSQGQELNFITITSHERLKTTESCLAVWRKSWRILRERLRRKHEKCSDYPLCFFLVTEFHKDRRLHWHGVINCDISTRWLKDNARACGLGFQCKSTQLENAIQGTNYAIKYISKSLTNEDYPPKMRRITYSQSFPHKPAPDSSFEWQIPDAKTSLVEVIEQAWREFDYDTYLHGQEIQEIVTE